MFRTLARLLNDPTLTDPKAPLSPDVFLIHPLQLSRWLEQAWSFGGRVSWANLPDQPPFLGDTGTVANLQLPAGLLDDGLRSGIDRQDPNAFGKPPAPGQRIATGLPWEHLVYAYLVENTGVYEILAEVVRRYVVGETLEAPSLATQRWLRATEDLFFRESPLFHITGTTSQLRTDPRITRRNAYWRMFGMDLAHPLPPAYGPPTGGQPPWKRDVGVANLRFHEVWVELLRQVWLGLENASNTSGANPTDSAYISELCRVLRDMLNMRRRFGQLAREEFVDVATMSWFHLTIESNTPLVKDLKADSADAADRLAKMGQRVGITPPRQARECLELSDLVSTVLRFIELGAFDTQPGAQLLYLGSTQVQEDMNRIIDLWQSATGDRIKDVAVRAAVPARASAQPASLPAAADLKPAAQAAAPVDGGRRR